MAVLLSIKFWMKLLSTLLDSIFPVGLVFLVLAPFKKDAWARNPAVPLAVSALGLCFMLRIGIFFSGIPFERRYFMPVAFLAMVFAAPGLAAVPELLEKAGLKWKLKGSHIVAALLTAAFLICVGKALNPSFDKLWMKKAAAFVKEDSAGVSRAYLIMDGDDLRIPYYADASFIHLCMDGNDEVWESHESDKKLTRKNGVLAFKGHKRSQRDYSAMPEMEPGLEHLAENIKKLESDGSKAFVLIETDPEKFEGLFKRKGLEFPLAKLHELKGAKNRPAAIYTLKEHAVEAEAPDK